MSLPDSFTGSNGTALTAYDALYVSNSAHSGVLEIQSNKVVIRGTPAASAMVVRDEQPASADYDVSADFQHTSSIAGQVGIVGRADKTANTHYHWRINGSDLQLYKFIAGTATQLGSTVASGYVANSVVAMLLNMVGNAIKGFWGGVQKISVTDSSISSIGYGGLRINTGSAGTLDNLNITNIGSGSSTDLVVSDSTHGHAADNLGLSSDTALTIAEAGHGHLADGVTLTTEWLLSVDDALHSQVADNVTLSLADSITLILADALHAHSSDSPALSVDTWLAIAEAIHGHTAESPALSTQTELQIAEALHAHYADAVVLGLASFTQDELDYLLAYMEANMNIWDQPIDGAVTARQLFVMMAKILRNKMITDPATGTLTVFDDDSTTPLLSANIFKDAAGTTPYNGTGAERRERLA